MQKGACKMKNQFSTQYKAIEALDYVYHYLLSINVFISLRDLSVAKKDGCYSIYLKHKLLEDEKVTRALYN